MGGVSFGVAFAAGLASILSPCILPMVPSYLTTMAGTALTGEAVQSRTVRARVMVNAVLFVAGMSLILVISGLLATSLGQFVRSYRNLLSQLGGMVIALFGLELMGVIQLGILKRDWHMSTRVHGGRGWSAFLLGVIFATGWTPCVGPILASIIIMASAAHSVWAGGVLLATYAAGLAVPFLALALFLGQAAHWTRRLGRYVVAIERVSGALLVVLGALLMTHWYARIPGLVAG
ncbi:MAG: cytochrome c biogenesis CcdA family protein [Thermaerobacter sp.]|nr:cytochrome c biogenesis CcdA family protein [Thermaerobacter sp.]